MSDTILVTGATGNTGSGIAPALAAKGHRVRALVRDPGKPESLKEAGVEIAVGDLGDPSTLGAELFEGVGKVYFCTWNGPDATEQWKNFREALERAGASPHVFRLAAFGTPDSRIVAELEKAVEDLKGSGLPWTILQPTFFMQNTMMTAPTIKEQGKIYWDWADGRAAMIDVRDIVDSAVGAIAGDEGVEGETFLLLGPRPIGFAEVAQILGDVLGKEIDYVPVPHEAAVESMQQMGVPEWVAEGYAELSEGFANGFADRTSYDVEKLAGRPPRDFETFANDFREAWG